MSQTKSEKTRVIFDNIKSTLKERLSTFLANSDLSDVIFYVGEWNESDGPVDKEQLEKIPAHKFLLSASSIVFKKMFSGNWAEKNEVIVTDTHSVAFHSMLRYIYCDEIDLENEYLLSVLYLAKKYDLPVLANKVACRILEILNEENFFDLIEPAAQFELKNVNDVIGKTIQFNTEWLIKCNKFTELHRSTLAMILDQPKLSVKESTLFEACVTWAKKECKRNDIEHPTSVQLRNALGNLIYKFRIASFSAKEFTDGPGKSKIYTDSEMLDCMFYISSKYVRSGIYQFSSLFEREIPQPIVIESPFSINIENGAYWDSSSYTSWTMKSDCVLKFNKTVSVVSFSFKSSYNNLQFTKLTITDQTNSNEFLMIENPCSKQENKCVVVFKMNVPVAFQAGKEYIISLFADSTNKFQYCSSFFSYPYYDMKPVHFSNGLKAEFLSERMPIQLCLLRLHISN